MPRYISLWEMDTSRMPSDPKERLALLQKMIDMTKQSLKENPGSQWGTFVGENKGFSLSSEGGTWQGMMKIQQMFAPYVHSKVYQAASIEEAEEVLKSMMQQK